MKGLYIHIPFCKQICNYCDFPKIVSKDDTYKKYIMALESEMISKRSDLTMIDTVYIGGGTPNILSDSLLDYLFSLLASYIKGAKEITIECNPELITKSQVEIFKKYGINRISLGVQTINPERLTLLGRKHTQMDVNRAVSILRDADIQNISMDFIYGTPGSSIEELDEDINYIEKLSIPHVSFYALIIEDKTVFSYLHRKRKIRLLDDDIIADMYDHINRRLKGIGFHHYEVSNYAKDGFESIHNKLYWETQEYIAIGMGAAGYVRPYRYTNYRTLTEYLTKTEEIREFISIEDEKKEFMMLGLRMLRGIDMEEYTKRFNSICLSDFDLNKHLSSGMLKINGNRLYIPEEKIFIANVVYEEFV